MKYLEGVVYSDYQKLSLPERLHLISGGNLNNLTMHFPASEETILRDRLRAQDDGYCHAEED